MSDRLGRMVFPFLFLTMLCGMAMGAEESTEVTCSIFRRASFSERLMFVSGYSAGAITAAVYGANEVPAEESAHRTLMYVLPKDYRLGAILLEVDVWCERAENRPKPVVDILLNIAKEKNAVLIKQQQDLEVQRLVDRLLREHPELKGGPPKK